jgi:hypothetical protein
MSGFESISTHTEIYYDKFAVYLSSEQQSSRYLLIRNHILQYQRPISESYKSNPPKSFWGYLILEYQGCVVQEVSVNFSLQQIYEKFDVWASLHQYLCVRFGELYTDFQRMSGAPPQNGSFEPIRGLASPDLFLGQGIDTIRFVGNEAMVVALQIFWLTDSNDYGVCAQSPDTIPAAADPSPTGQPYNPPAGSPVDTPTGSDSAPTIASPTNQPADAPAGDYGPRNPPHTEVCSAGYKVKCVGTLVAGDGIGTPIPGAIANIVCPHAGPYSVSVSGGPFNAGGGYGNYYTYQVTDSGGSVVAIPAGWYTAPTATFNGCV